MRNRAKIIISLVILAVAIVTIAGVSLNQEQAENSSGESSAQVENSNGESAAQVENSNGESAASGELKAGVAAPDFSVKLLSGDTFTLSDHKGKVVFLNFWATWCPPCVAEMPAIQELSEKYADSAVFIGVDYAENTEKVKNFIAEKGYTYHIGLDEDGSVSKNLYPTDGIPYTLIIDAKGIISEIFIGGGDQMHSVFEQAIIEALGR